MVFNTMKNTEFVEHKIKNQDETRKVMTCSRFYSAWRKPNPSTYTSHVEMDITRFSGMAGVYTIGDRDYEVVPGDIVLVRSNEKHKITSVSQAGAIENIMFDPVFLWESTDYFGLNYFGAFNTGLSDFEHKIERNSHIYDIVNEMINCIYDEFNRGEYGHIEMIKMRMYMMLFAIARDMGYCESSKDSVQMPQIEAIRASIEFIDDHLCENITIPMLAEVANLSPNYYRTLFKKIVGTSPVKYITSKRVKLASKMLKTYEGNMLDLALECGFNSTASFNRAFRMYTGQVPSKYLPYVL